jgi:SAM-dependent methyltransferase
MATTPATTKYAFEHDKPERLSGIEATWDPGTQELLRRLGIGPGARCLEAGAGGGSIAAWMAEQVGATGYVLATDIDTTHLDPLASDVLEVRHHDLRSDPPLPDASFDIAHARHLLSWLGDCEAIERLVATLKPGGVLLVEDFDWSNDPGGGSELTAKGYDAIVGLVETIGYDSRYGRDTVARLQRAGLADVAAEGRAYIISGGSPGTAFERFSLDAQRDALIATGRLTAEEVDGMAAHLSDPANNIFTPVLYAAWGRRPG